MFVELVIGIEFIINMGLVIIIDLYILVDLFIGIISGGKTLCCPADKFRGLDLHGGRDQGLLEISFRIGQKLLQDSRPFIDQDAIKTFHFYRHIRLPRKGGKDKRAHFRKEIFYLVGGAVVKNISLINWYTPLF